MANIHRIAGALLAGAVLAGSAVVIDTGPALAAPGTAPAGSITWKKCGNKGHGQCGTLTVPIDWAHPKRGTIKVAVARLKARNARARLGTLFVNPGGPGGSGVDFALDESAFSAKVRDRFDVIGIDPRGVERSHPVKCGDVGKAPSPYPRTEREFAALRTYGAKLHRACRAKTGPLYDFLDAGSVARDMDAVRAALGERTLNYYGVSYGTWLGQRYAELFPRRIRTMALDSNMNHSSPTALSFSVEEAGGLEVSYAQFARWCAATTGCALHDKGAVKVLDALMARADAGLLHESGKPNAKITPEDISEELQGTMYDAAAWPELAGRLNSLGTGRAQGRPRTTTAARRETDGTFPSILCADFRFNVRNLKQLQDIRARSRRAAPHTRLNPLGWAAITACLGRPTPARDPQRPYKVNRAPHLLLTNSLADPATVYPWATGVARQIRRSTLLTYDGTGHGDYWLSPCSRTAIDTYLVAGTVPPRGTHCPAVTPHTGIRTQQVPRAVPHLF